MKQAAERLSKSKADLANQEAKLKEVGAAVDDAVGGVAEGLKADAAAMGETAAADSPPKAKARA